jgi:hypothetical protein
LTTPITDTHRRAALRGREAVAQWRIKGAVWAGRIFALVIVVVWGASLLRKGGPDFLSVVVLALLAAGLLFAAEKVRHGSRAASVVLLLLFVLIKLLDWLGGTPIYTGALWAIIIVGALVNGVWGTFALARIRRDAELIPPAPLRGERVPSGMPSVNPSPARDQTITPE